MHLYLLFFFFSSRRRHTRFDCDWSSDVCSSDLLLPGRFRRAAELRKNFFFAKDEIFLVFDFDFRTDRKSTRLNSSHSQISYAVFCLKKKKKPQTKPCPPRYT